MKLLKLIAIGVLALTTVSAQEKTPAPKEEPFEATIVPVKTLTGESFGRLVKLLNIFNTRFSSDERLRIIVIYAPKETVAQMRKVISELDRPGSDAAIGHNIEMNLTFLKCSTKPTASGATPLPPDLESVAKQLRAATQYKDIQLWETLPLQLQEGKMMEHTGRIPMSLPDFPNLGANLQLRIHPESVISKANGRYVRFERLNVSLKVPITVNKASFQYQDVGFNTSGEFKEGQKSVLGKLSGVEDDGAVFVVISLKVVD